MEAQETLPRGGRRREHDTGSQPMHPDYTPPYRTFIYALVDPRTEVVRYVGKADNPETRLQMHLRYEGGNPHKDRWIKQLERSNFVPTLCILEECGKNWPEREQFWIRHHRELGAPLTNLTDGGEGVSGHKHSSQSRAKMSESHVLLWSDPEYRKERAAAIRRAQSTPEYRARFLERVADPELCARISATVKERWAKQEVRDRMVQALRRSHSTEEAKANHSAASKRLWEDPEYRAKTMAAAKLGWAKRRASLAE